MKRFVLGLVIGFMLGLASVILTLAFLFRIPVSTASSTVEPTLLLENDRLRAWELILEVGQSTPVHTHQLDELVVCLESGILRITKPGLELDEQTVQPKFGEVFMPKVKGVTHMLTNSGASRYRQISIELK